MGRGRRLVAAQPAQTCPCSVGPDELPMSVLQNASPLIAKQQGIRAHPTKVGSEPHSRIWRRSGTEKWWRWFLPWQKRGAEFLPSPCSLQGCRARGKAGPKVSLLPWEGRWVMYPGPDTTSMGVRAAGTTRTEKLHSPGRPRRFRTRYGCRAGIHRALGLAGSWVWAQPAWDSVGAFHRLQHGRYPPPRKPSSQPAHPGSVCWRC